MPKLIMIISMLVISSIVVAAEVYMWTDANGVKRFSNTAPPADAKALGKETNYTAPPEPPKPKLTADDRAIMKDKETQLQIERQKTMQKTMDASAAKANAEAAAFDSIAKTTESTGKNIRVLFGGRP